MFTHSDLGRLAECTAWVPGRAATSGGARRPHGRACLTYGAAHCLPGRFRAP